MYRQTGFYKIEKNQILRNYLQTIITKLMPNYINAFTTFIILKNLFFSLQLNRKFKQFQTSYVTKAFKILNKLYKTSNKVNFSILFFENIPEIRKDFVSNV